MIILLSTLVGAGVSIFLFKKKTLNLGRGTYISSFPIILALIGNAIVTQAFQSTDYIVILSLTIAIAAIGFMRDYLKISYASLIPYTILVLLISYYSNINLGEKGSALGIVASIIWPITVIVCLKLAALVYEMPFILTSVTSLTFLLFFSQQLSTPTIAIDLNYILLIPNILFLLYSSTGNRILIGSSGIMGLGYLISTISMLGQSKSLLIFGLLVPSMVIFFPFALICFMIISSYFGNKLHIEKSNRSYEWNLKREKLVVFSGLIFLCLNFLALLVEVQGPSYGYIALFVLLVASLSGFFKAYARKLETTEKAENPQINIKNIEIDSVTQSEAFEIYSNYLNQNTPQSIFHVVTADSLAIVRAEEDINFKNILKRASLVVPDGAGIVWAADFLGTPLKGRVPGVAMVSALCKLSAKKDWSIFFLGSKPGVAQKAVNLLIDESPNLKIAGVEHGYFQENSEEEEQVISKIANAKPDILFVALGVPRQEWFITKLRPILKNSIAIGVGGSFDVISGSLPRAPIWMQKFGIEWLFRLYMEPKRFLRMLNIPKFVISILRYKWNSKSKIESPKS